MAKTYKNYVTEYTPLMKNIMHRGMGIVAPECTEMAYRYAALAGYKYAENDLWFTSDGYPVMVHMRDISCVSNGKGNVDELTLEELKKIDFGYAVWHEREMFADGPAKMLTFEEWIALCKEIDINPYIDCKMFVPKTYEGVHGVETCLNILKKYGMERRATWIVGVSGAKSVLEYDPNARVAFIFDKEFYDDTFEYMKTVADINNPDKIIAYMSAKHITKDMVDRCKAVGINFEAWHAKMCYDEPELAVELYKKGVTGFCNDSLNIGKALKEAGYTW